MTSLARQLLSLQAASIPAKLGSDNRRKSLLWEPKDAATKDRDTVYEIGRRGFERLQCIDPLFSKYDSFDNILFSPSSMDFNRDVQTQKVNDNLDESIHNFLIVVSPHLQQRSALESLEWLVYRFTIHENKRNVDDLLTSALLHHDSVIFVKIVQIISLDSAAHKKWHWLESSAKAGVPVSRGTLVNHARSDTGFLRFLFSRMEQFVRVLGHDSRSRTCAPVAMYTVIGVGVLPQPGSSAPSENLVAVLIDSLQRSSLKSECDDLKAGGYMILSKLCTTATLNSTMLESVISILVKNMIPGMSIQGLTCLAIVTHYHSLKSLPEHCYPIICNLPGVGQMLIKLCSEFSNVQTLLFLILQWVIDHTVMVNQQEGESKHLSMLTDILTSVELDSDAADSISRHILMTLAKQHSNPIDARWTTMARPLMSILERRWSTHLQSNVEALQEEKQYRNAVHDLLMLTLTPVRYQVIPQLSTNLVLGLNHAESVNRLAAVRYLMKKIKRHDQDLQSDFVSEQLLCRLQDSCPNIVSKLLSQKKVLIGAVDKSKLAESLTNLVLTWHGKKEWRDIEAGALEVLCDEEIISSVPELSVWLLPFLLVSNVHEINFVALILESKACRVQPMSNLVSQGIELKARKTDMSYNNLQGVRKAHQMIDRFGQVDMSKPESELLREVNMLIVNSLTEGLLKMSPTDYLALVIGLVRWKHLKMARSQFLLQLVLCNALPRLINRKDLLMTVALDTVGLVELSLAGCPRQTSMHVATSHEIKDLLKPWLKHLKQTGVVPRLTAIWSLDVLIKTLKSLPIAIVTEEDTFLKVFSKLLELIGMESSDDCVAVLSDRISQEFNKELLFQSLALILVQNAAVPDSRKDAIAIVNCCFKIICKACTDVDMEKYIISSQIIPNLLVYVTNPLEMIRRSSVQALRAILGVHRSSSTYRLFKKLTKNEDEIASDAAYAPMIIGHKLSKSRNKLNVDDIVTWYSIRQMSPYVKRGLLKLLCLVPHELVLDSHVLLAELIITEAGYAESAVHLDILQLVLERFDPSSAVQFTLGSRPLGFLLRALAANDRPLGDGRSLQSLALSQITRAFFRALPGVESQRLVVTTLVDVSLHAKETTAVVTCLKQLRLKSEHVCEELKTESESEIVVKKGVKKTRVERTLRSFDIRRIVIVLEALQSCKKFADVSELLTLLFGLLSRLMTEDGDDVDYCKLMTLTCLYNACSSRNSGPVQRAEKGGENKAANVEVLVQCIRNSLSPQIQQQALFVMTAIAPLYPEYMLHNAMSIFTFVGGNLAQHDDVYSFQLITLTINTIIPALIAAQGNASSATLHKLVVDIVRVFVDARHHIPQHRSLLLFHELVDKLGVNQTLCIVGLLVIESSVRTKDVPALISPGDGEPQKLASVERDIAFAVSIFSQFPVPDQLESITRLVHYLHQLLSVENNKETSLAKLSADRQLLSGTLKRDLQMSSLVSVDQLVSDKSLSAQQLRLVKYSISRLLVTLLANDQLVSQVVQLVVDGDVNLEPMFERLVTTTICYVTAVSRYSAVQSAGTAAFKFWKSIEQRSFDMLEKVNYVLPLSQFIVHVSSLFKHDMLRVREKAHTLVNLRLRQLNADRLDADEVDLLKGNLIARLVDIVSSNVVSLTSSSTDASNSSILLNITQLALMGLQLLCRLLGGKNPELFDMVNDVIKKILGSDECRRLCPVILANALLYVAELLTSLKDRALTCLAAFMQSVLSISSDLQMLYNNEPVLTSLMIVFQKALTHIPKFISPYVIQILLCVCLVSSSTQLTKFDSKSQTVVRLTAVRQLLATAIEPRILLSGLHRPTESRLSSVYNKLIDVNQIGVVVLLDIVKHHAAGMSREDLDKNQDFLWMLFCQHLINIRNDCNELTCEQMNTVEEGLVSAVLATVLRLPESSFRTVKFAKLYIAACGEDDLLHRNRKLTFFRICESLATKLQALFVPIISQTLNAVCGILKEINSSESDPVKLYYGDSKYAMKQTCGLLNAVLGCVYRCLLYNREDKDNAHDAGGLFTLDGMKQLMHPLVDQLGNWLGGDEETERRLTELVIPCIAQLSLECHKDADTLRQLNRLVCQKTKPADSSPKVRFAALKVIEEMARKLGDMYEKLLLPETIVTLTELIEDETEEVELQCQKVMRTLQELFGDDII